MDFVQLVYDVVTVSREGGVVHGFQLPCLFVLKFLPAFAAQIGTEPVVTGSTEEVNPIEPLADKFKAFGFSVKEINGNSVEELDHIFKTIPFESGKPNLIIANTSKGKGISFIENVVSWHHRVPNDEEYKLAIEELNLEQEKLIQ